MDFFLPPTWSSILSLPTIHVVTSGLLVAQSLVVALQIPSLRRIPGLHLWLITALVLALDSGLALARLDGGPALIAQGQALVLIAASALQYAALTLFVGARPSPALIATLVGGGSVFLLVSQALFAAVPVQVLRDSLVVPLLFAAALALRRLSAREVQGGAALVLGSLAGAGILAILRIGIGLIGVLSPPLGGDGLQVVDALLGPLFGFLWISGMLAMATQRLEEERTNLIRFDGLTGCLRRPVMLEVLEEEQQRFRRYGHPYTLVMIDLDRFKMINETRGQDTGDQVLIRVASVLQTGLRVTDRVARWAGESFLVLLPETPEAEGSALAERLRQDVALRASDHDGLDVTLSAGVAGVRAGQEVEAVCQRAEEALVLAKQKRNRVETAR